LTAAFLRLSELHDGGDSSHVDAAIESIELACATRWGGVRVHARPGWAEHGQRLRPDPLGRGTLRSAQRQQRQAAPQHSRWDVPAHRRMGAKRSSLHGQEAWDFLRESRKALRFFYQCGSPLCLGCAVRSSGSSCSARFECTSAAGVRSTAADTASSLASGGSVGLGYLSEYPREYSEYPM
jgi:hypothetical protein